MTTNSKHFVIRIMYMGNPEMLTGEITIAYLANINPMPGTNYHALFTNTSGKPYIFISKEVAMQLCEQLQEKLNDVAKIINPTIKKGPHAKYLEFFVKVVPWDSAKFLADMDEHNYLRDKKAVQQRIRNRQLFRSRKNDKPIVDDLNDYQ